MYAFNLYRAKYKRNLQWRYWWCSALSVCLQGPEGTVAQVAAPGAVSVGCHFFLGLGLLVSFTSVFMIY